MGFDVVPEPSQGSLPTCHCPFGKTAEDHPEIICKIGQGIVRGLMEAVRGSARPAALSPHKGPDETCIAEV